MLRHFANRRGELQAVIEPLPDKRNQAHGVLFSHPAQFPSRAVLAPGVGSSPAWIRTDAVFNFVRIFEHPTFRRTGGARSVAIINAAMARAQEQTGLRKPSHRTSQVRAVHGEHLELIRGDVPHPAGGIRGLPVGRDSIRIAKRREACLSFRKLTGPADRYPGVISSLTRDG